MPEQSKHFRRRTIWIDLDNSPHVPFFIPIIEQLEERGHTILLTARDCAQVYELVDFYNLPCTRIGRHFGKATIVKLGALFLRGLQLMPTILRQKPDLAVSHGSRAQLVVSSALRIPSLTIGDYEFAKGYAFVRPTWLMCPDVIPDARFDNCRDRILKYPGIKEDVYVPRFRPDPVIKSRLGLTSEDLVITVRPPADDAHYHNKKSDELFHAVICFLSSRPNIKMILLPRRGEQTTFVRKTWPHLFASGQIIIPEQVVDGLNLIWHSDLVISGGGTMNREAAALGVPVYSIFKGKIGAVDQYLAAHGRLTLIKNVEDIRGKIILARRDRRAVPENGNRPALQTIVNNIVAILESKCQTIHSSAL